MLGWLFGRKQKQNARQSTIPPMILRDSWEAGAGSSYVGYFQSQIEGIAKSLCRPEYPPVYARFAVDQRSAEIYDKDGSIAYISVCGEAGIPEKVIVTTDLPQKKQALFTEAFPRLRVKFYEFADLH